MNQYNDDNPVQQEELDSEEEANFEWELDQEPSREENAAPDEQAQAEALVEQAADVDAVMPSEIAAINTDNDTANDANKE